MIKVMVVVAKVSSHSKYFGTERLPGLGFPGAWCFTEARRYWIFIIHLFILGYHKC